MGIKRKLAPCIGARKAFKESMIHNTAKPEVTVDAQTYEVKADGVPLVCEPATELPLAQRYCLF